MGLKGNLSTVNLAEIFQTLSSGNSSGLLRIQAPEGPRFVEIRDGAISVAGRSADRIMLGDLLISRGLIDEEKLEGALQIQKEGNKLLGQVLIDLGYVAMEHLEEALRFQVEEEVCELFLLKSGDFDFLANATLDAKIAPAGGMVKMSIDPNALLEEAARRAQDWGAVEQRIPTQAMLFLLTASGQQIVKSGEGVSAEGAILLKLIHGQRTIEAMVQKACLGRQTTNQMLIELWDAGMIEPMPIASYEKVAKEHLRLKRIDEAQRIAGYMLSAENGAYKEQAQLLLDEVEKARKLARQASSVAVNADPKVRSEVIRRAQPNLILKKERSMAPLVIAIVLLLAGGGAAAYFLLFAKGKPEEGGGGRKQFDEVALQSHDKLVAGDYNGAIELLRDFKTFDPEIKKLATEAFNKTVRDVEDLVLKSIERFSAAYAAEKPEELAAAAKELDGFANVGISNDAVRQQRARALEKLSMYKERELSGVLQTRLTEILDRKKNKSSDAMEQALNEFLTAKPPEKLAVTAREEVGRLTRARIEAGRVLKQAEALRAGGEVEAAMLEFERVKQLHPESALSASAEKGLSAIADATAAARGELSKIDVLITQKKNAEAKTALAAFLNSNPPQTLMVRAFDMLQSISPDTEADATAIKDAMAQAEKAPDTARATLIEAVDKRPLTRAAAKVTLKVQVASQPPGAEVFLDGQPAGKTPTTLSIPALGKVAITFKKEGFQTQDLYKHNCREESIAVTLNRIPAVVRRMPHPARGGIEPGADMVNLVGGGELVQVSRLDLKVARRIALPVGDAAGDGAAPTVSTGLANVIICGQQKQLLDVRLPAGDIARMTLGEAATSAPVIYSSDQLPGKRLVALAVRDAFEVWDLETGKQHRRVNTGASEHVPFGLARDGEFFLVPRESSVACIMGHSGEKKWDLPLEGKVSGSPASRGGAGAVVTEDGKMTVFDATGKAKGTRALGAAVFGGCAMFGDAVLVVFKDGKVEAASLTEDKPAWSANLEGPPVLLPLVIQDKDTRFAAFATSRGGDYYATVLAADGKLLFHALLTAKPVALGTDGRRLLVSTEDADLSAYDLK